jgi:hypothetical protein
MGSTLNTERLIKTPAEPQLSPLLEGFSKFAHGFWPVSFQTCVKSLLILSAKIQPLHLEGSQCPGWKIGRLLRVVV